MAVSARCFEVVQYEINPETGESLGFNENNILSALEHKTIKKWAYIRHDKDVYTDEEEISSSGMHKCGESRPAHWHCVCKCDRSLELDVVARWFNVSVNQIQIGRGRSAFEEKVRYLTHEDEKQRLKGKYRYDDAEVCANFDWREMLDKLESELLKYGRKLSARDRFRYDVLYNGMTLRECELADRVNYMHDFDRLKKLRMEYINKQKPPTTRINYYVCGRGGIGKGLICRAIARSLFPQMENDDDIFHVVGAEGVALDGYDGQPVIIWDDCRAKDLYKKLGGRGNVFNVFDTHPVKQRQSVKFGSVNLCNAVNIVTSPDDYVNFLDGLAGAEDKKQSYRRFPMIIPLHEEDFDLLINKGFLNNTSDFFDYVEYRGIRGNMQEIALKCGQNEKLRREIENKTVKVVTDKHNQLVDAVAVEPDEDVVKEELSDYGQVSMVFEYKYK